ncbi:hypothetical protein H6G41_07160 [Tolypothrix sp. FACHB-123]|nr:hypothetical protein [Tolypothrix sp. FACHB-123]
MADGEASGLLKILQKQGVDEILGAIIVACDAGEMISEVTTAIVGKLCLNKGLPSKKIFHYYCSLLTVDS